MPKLSRVGIVGAGAMGAGITLDCALKGLDAFMADRDQSALDSGMARIKSLLDQGLDEKRLSHEDVAATLMRIKTTTGLDDLADCHLVIEAVYEDPEVKRDLLAQLEDKVDKNCILATNTNSLGVEELAQGLDTPQRLVGLHFFPRPYQNRLLEIVPGPKTPPEILNACQKLAARLDKDTILTGDRPGFAVNRFFIPWLNEALRLREENLASAANVDRYAREAFGSAQGPFQLLESLGAKTVLDASRYLGAKLGGFYAPADSLEAMAQGKQRPWEPWDKTAGDGREEIQNRLLGAVFLAACQMLEEKVASALDAELGARLGLGWGAGPFGLMNRLGLDHAVSVAEDVAQRHEGMTLPGCLAHASGPWLLPLASYQLHPGKIGLVTLRRMAEGNALTPELMEDLDRALDMAESDPECETVLLKGLGGFFCGGLDTAWLLGELKGGSGPEVIEIMEQGRRLLGRISTCPKWVACLLDGPALGAGAELALACHTIVATPRGKLGFPETGMGIYPGLGGVQRSLKPLGAAMASYLVLTGRVLDAEEARQLCLVEYLVPDGSGMETVTQLTGRTPLTKRGPAPGPQAGYWADMAEAFSDGQKLERLLSPEGPPEDAAEDAKTATLLAGKAPLALRAAVKLINEGSRLSLEEGLDLESDSLKEIYQSKDALEGLAAVVEHRSPVYVGA